MNLNELTTDEIKGLLNVSKVLNALLDKISVVEEQITHNRDQIDELSKTVAELATKVNDLQVTTDGDLKQLKSDVITLGQKMYSAEQAISDCTAEVAGVAKIIETLDPSRLEKKESKAKDQNVNKDLREVKKIRK